MRCLLVALVSQCGDAYAWGDEGHKIVCEIAFRLAQPDTRSAVRKLIRSHTEVDTFSKILASKSAKKADRLSGLKFLGHSGKLHSTWDTCFVENAV